ncbi:hypothetical protein R1T16_08355 [Flavobacterium sp. DG1-102-2]|uniref:hypothetical protein n=1 Tax=Flavobacterium sp. DG1-102-2 TaxID=3081663 RepID=UPI002948F801|nr:hypothetical protein [Flavobacterium sp. DG1-102-2]MDV6168437.1 hypothetical protein [Flavobacterium sp. DG1-102-2]
MAQLSYSKFLWNSVNLHGVHSPFVFGITRALNTKTMLYPKTATETLDRKTIDILFRILVNLHKERLVILGDDATAVVDLLRNYGEELKLKLWFFSTFAPISGNLDLIYISASDTAPILPQIETLMPSIGSNTVCAIGNIHSSAQAEYDWETIKKDPRVTVSIDTYHLGLIFFRPEQAKEHFMIRTTTSKVLDFALGAKNLWGLLY